MKKLYIEKANTEYLVSDEVFNAYAASELNETEEHALWNILESIETPHQALTLTRILAVCGGEMNNHFVKRAYERFIG